MVTDKRCRVFAGLLALLLALPLPGAFAGTTGKIAGRVTDLKGSPLPGANVVIEGIKRGATTDLGGFYVIVSVDPGLYDLTASIIGFSKVTKRQVSVAVDYTSTVNFTLQEKEIEAAEVVVTAEHLPVEADKTSTKYIVSSQDIAQIPVVKTMSELISLQPGVDQAGTMSIRGSDIVRGTDPEIVSGHNAYVGNDVYVMVDGVRIPNKDGNSSLLFAGVNKSAVQQISVETGVTPAEYGDAQAGTINIVTQDGGQDYHGWAEVNFEPAGQKHWGANVYDSPIHRGRMRWNDPAWLQETDPVTGRLIHVREDYTGWSGLTAEGSLSGPIGRKASFMASLRHERRAATFPSATSHGFYNDRGKFINAPNNIQGSGSLTLKPTENTKVKVGLVLQRYTAFNDEYNNRGEADDSFIRGMARSNGRNLFLPKDWASSGKYTNLEQLAYATFTHALSSRTFYEVRIARSQTKVDTANAYPWTEDPRMDKSGWFFIDRKVASWVKTDRKRYSIKADLSSQLTRGNFVKAGLEIVRYDTYYTFWSSSSKTANRFVMSTGGDTPWIMGTPARPIQGAFYVQDKMEFEGLIVNVGLRFDFFKHTHKELMFSGMQNAPMWRTYATRQYAYGVGTGEGVVIADDFVRTPPMRFYISPRLGVSHPITDRMAMHFSLGRFVQWPSIFDIYAKSYQSTGAVGPDGDPSWRDVNGNRIKDPAEALNNMDFLEGGIAGDPETHPEEAMTFEVGADWNFVSDYTASLTAWYRSETNQIVRAANRWGGPRQAGTLRGQANGRAAYVKGVDISIGKRLSNYFSFRLAWTANWSAQGDMGIAQYHARMRPDSVFVVSGEFWYNFKGLPDGSLVPVPLTANEKVQFGRQANNQVLSNQQTTRDDPIVLYGKIPELSDKAIYMEYGALSGLARGPLSPLGEERVDGRLSQANLQFVLSTPADVRIGNRWVNWLFSDLSANLLWKIRTGALFKWTPPGGKEVAARGPTSMVTDLSVEKAFTAGNRVRPSFFIEVRNLFNERADLTAPGAKYMQWGLQMPDPNNSDFLKYGDVEAQLYSNAPRRTALGFRISF